MMMMIMMISWKHFFCLFQKTNTQIITKLERFICPRSWISDCSIFLVFIFGLSLSSGWNHAWIGAICGPPPKIYGCGNHIELMCCRAAGLRPFWGALGGVQKCGGGDDRTDSSSQWIGVESWWKIDWACLDPSDLRDVWVTWNWPSRIDQSIYLYL